MHTLFLHEAGAFHNLSTPCPQSYPLNYPQAYPQVKNLGFQGLLNNVDFVIELPIM